MRAFLISIFLLSTLPSWSQNWITLTPEHFPEAKMASEGVEMVNIYELYQEKAGDEEKEKGQVVRVVRSPTRSYSFDKAGNLTEHIEFIEETGQVKMRAQSEFGPHGVASKETKVYVTETAAKVSLADTANVGMRLAVLRKFTYEYDENGYLASKTIGEHNGEERMTSDSSLFEYAHNGKLLKMESHRLLHGVMAESEFNHHSDREVTINKKGGNKTELELDALGHIISIQEYYNGNPSASTDIQHFYTTERLDSSMYNFSNHRQPSKAIESFRMHYFYDKSGKLVMIRSHFSDGKVLETLHEYFYFHEND